MKKKGFTMPEMVITLGIIGVLAIILLSVLRHSDVNENEHIFKKALFLTERVMQEMRADESLYKDGDLSKPVKGELTDSTFCQNFAQNFKIKSDISCVEHAFVDGEAPDGTFTTIDGIVWKLPITTFANEIAVIQVDVNGNKRPNCFASEECAKPDRFAITVYTRITPDEEVKPGDKEPEPTPEPEPEPEPTPGIIPKPTLGDKILHDPGLSKGLLPQDCRPPLYSARYYACNEYGYTNGMKKYTSPDNSKEWWYDY